MCVFLNSLVFPSAVCKRSLIVEAFCVFYKSSLLYLFVFFFSFLFTGTGYRLIIVKTTECDVREVRRVVQHSIPSARLNSDINAELTFALPDDQTAKFPALFRTLDKKKRELGIRSFGVNACTMEEVFLK